MNDPDEIHPSVVYLVRFDKELVPVAGHKLIAMLRASRALFGEPRNSVASSGAALPNDNVTAKDDDK